MYWSKQEDSHIFKHHQIHHGGVGKQQFHPCPVRFLRTPLTGQIHKAVRIQRWGHNIVLHSKGEYNRCKIRRITLGEEIKDKIDNRRIQEEKKGDHKVENRMGKRLE